MTDKVALGRKGEIFVMRKIMDEGWTFPNDSETYLESSDWVFEKNGRKITIQVKTSTKLKRFSFNNFKRSDYLIFTDLRDIWVIPNEMLKVSDKISKTYEKLKNKIILLEKQKSSLLAEINDCGVTFGELNSFSPFLNEEMPFLEKKGGIHIDV